MLHADARTGVHTAAHPAGPLGCARDASPGPPDPPSPRPEPQRPAVGCAPARPRCGPDRGLWWQQLLRKRRLLQIGQRDPRRGKTAAADASSVHVAGSLTSGGTPLRSTWTSSPGMADAEGLRGRALLRIDRRRRHRLHQRQPRVLQPLRWRRRGHSCSKVSGCGRPPPAANWHRWRRSTNFSRLLDQTLASSGTLVKGAGTTIAGQPVIELRDASKSGSLYVATSGQPYPSKSSSAAPKQATFPSLDDPARRPPPARSTSVSCRLAGHPSASQAALRRTVSAKAEAEAACPTRQSAMRGDTHRDDDA